MTDPLPPLARLIEALEPFAAWAEHLMAIGSRRLGPDEYPEVYGWPQMKALYEARDALAAARAMPAPEVDGDEIEEALSDILEAADYLKTNLDAGEEIYESKWLDSLIQAHGTIGEVYNGMAARAARLASLLARCLPVIDKQVCYASTMTEHEPNALAVEIRNAFSGYDSHYPGAASPLDLANKMADLLERWDGLHFNSGDRPDWHAVSVETRDILTEWNEWRMTHDAAAKPVSPSPARLDVREALEGIARIAEFGTVDAQPVNALHTILHKARAALAAAPEGKP